MGNKKASSNKSSRSARSTAVVNALPSAESDEHKDENAVNREIAALLLNLHASREKGVDNYASVKETSPQSGDDIAIDLSKSNQSKSQCSSFVSTEDRVVGRCHPPTSVHSTTIITSVAHPPMAETKPVMSSHDGTLDLTKRASGDLEPPALFQGLSSLNDLERSQVSSMSSNYLLQNLLMGKMQQIVSGKATQADASKLLSSLVPSTSPSSQPGCKLSFPTKPLPAKALSLNSPINEAKPPASVLKSPLSIFSTTNCNSHSAAAAAAAFNGTGSPLTLPVLPTSPHPNVPRPGNQASQGSENKSANNIPLLCGQIVAQLNGLLFLVHSLNSPQIELNLESQLTAIYSHLQELVGTVEQVKQRQTEEPQDSKSIIKNEEETLPDQQMPYSHTRKSSPQRHLNGVGKEDKNLAFSNNARSSSNVINVPFPDVNPTKLSEESEHQVESSTNPSPNGKRRRGRPPKHSNLDGAGSGSGLNKRSRGSQDGTGEREPKMQHSSPSSEAQSSSCGFSKVSGNGSIGGKGIRNRVFCGECPGCLKNDDCGRCRYCKDKTKFGGQNRLRQKCLHRRCQMDTHRRRASQGTVNIGVGKKAPVSAMSEQHSRSFSKRTPRRSPSPNAIYSGVDLARLAATAAAELASQNQILSQQEANGQGNGISTNSDENTNSVEQSTQERDSPDHPPHNVSVKATTNANGGGGLSDEEGEDSRLGGRSQSRIDKWKAKHEAMLRLAEDKATANPVNENDAPVDEHVEEDQTEKSDDKLPTIPDIEANGVCINLDEDLLPSKPLTRHGASVQQALSV
ncbi:hypothetical protein TCAL_09697 [Tigriopus californicus]|uniref:CXXC-type domain-containing protein n=1 Tax=Tigriopus californicus TaxID=6832 RepID=A0A553NNM8_TIGCA|nr:uncharacterized protein LOC131879328 [Tigriopus californicus]TRY66997.1 hypothetical protein TCAL_09697 [Tigriopus californicus]|eukprot:TCALIF_09697-PA protein Name:"Similar to CXXC1 CXXC-type zinc finger protein 1 (Bos taurus)" AED:0.00 eAED:0.00 QI:724/1/1/1/0.5/0.33/3/867/797